MNPSMEMDWLAEHRPDPAPPAGALSERARASLIAQAARKRRARHATRALAAAGLVAVAGAATLGVHAPAGPGARVTSGRADVAIAAAPSAQTASSPLIRLAADVRLIPLAAQPGDATLVVKDTAIDGAHEVDGAVYGGYDLYTDSGEYFYAPDSLAQLQQLVNSDEPVPDSGDEASALNTIAGAAGKTPAQAREAVLGTFPHGLDPMPTPAQARAADNRLAKFGKHIPYLAPTPARWALHQDSIVWIAATQALAVGAGRPDVRAGAIKALSTITGVTQTPTEVAGESALKVDFAANSETIWLNATTGVPIQEQDGPDSATSYEVQRVTAASLPSQISPDARLR
ncbi:MAG TPA: hypothetical protein VFI42_12510 [Thermomicrobiaceae bacterium]|nr:hypothetical protein [Thermomicrobiaceae bacterium]